MAVKAHIWRDRPISGMTLERGAAVCPHTPKWRHRNAMVIEMVEYVS